MTSQAWQAFLKCIEEPPTYTIFIFCTTDPQKIPDTILNRVQRFNFAKIDENIIKDRLDYICKQEKFLNYEDSISYISKICNGSMREAISLLDKCAGYSNEISLDNVLYVLGGYSFDDYFNLINSLIDCNQELTFKIFEVIYKKNADLKLFVDRFISFCLDISKYLIFKDMSCTSLPNSMEEQVKNCTNFDNANSWYMYVLDKLLNYKNMLKTDSNPKSTLEIGLSQIVRCQ